MQDPLTLKSSTLQAKCYTRFKHVYPIRAPYGRPAPSLVAPSPAARCEGHPMRYTRFEKARIIGARALQISMGSPILIDVPSGVVDPIEIAWIEFNSGAIPITVKRET